jgi:hypothetical protein
VSPILPPKEDEEMVGKSAYLPKSIWTRLAEIAEETKSEDPMKRGYSRNEVMIHFLRWAIREHDAEKRTKRKKD